MNGKETKISKLRLQPKWEYNPYIFPTDKPVTIHKDSEGKIISNGSDSDPFKVKGMVRVREVDNEKFVKIYSTHVSAWMELSLPGQKVLQYIIMTLPKDQDQVFINLDKAAEYTGYSSVVSVYDGLNELINKQIIARSASPLLYFINPRFLFNGDRVVFAEAIMRNSQAIRERATIQQGMLEASNSGDVPAGATGPDQGVGDFFTDLAEHGK